MSCKTIRILLSAYLDSALDERELILVEEHLASCESCRRELKYLENVQQEVASLSPLNAPSGFKQSFLNKLDENRAPDQHATGSGRSWHMRRPVWLGMAASFLIVGISMAIWIISQGQMDAPTESMATQDRQVADYSPDLGRSLQSLGYGTASAEQTLKVGKKSGYRSENKKNDLDRIESELGDAEFTNSSDEANSELTENAIEVTRSSSVASADLVLVVESRDWQIPQNLVAMAAAKGRMVMDFPARVLFPHEAIGRGISGSLPGEQERESKPAKTGKGAGAWRGKVAEKGKSTARAEAQPKGINTYGEQEWVCLYLESDVKDIPQLISRLALTDSSSLWKGSVVEIRQPSDKGISDATGYEEASGNRIMRNSDWSNYEVSVSEVSIKEAIFEDQSEPDPMFASTGDSQSTAEKSVMGSTLPVSPVEKVMEPGSGKSDTDRAPTSLPDTSDLKSLAAEAAKSRLDLIKTSLEESGQKREGKDLNENKPGARRKILLIFPKPVKSSIEGADR